MPAEAVRQRNQKGRIPASSAFSSIRPQWLRCCLATLGRADQLILSPLMQMLISLETTSYGEFPGGPVIRTQCSHRQGHGFGPWLGN